MRLVLEGKRPPYVPWSIGFTVEAEEQLDEHYGTADLEGPLENHLLKLGSDIGFFEDLGDDRVRDVFGVVWDRSIDKDIGNVEGCVLPEPTLAGYEFPDPLDPRFFADIPAKIERFPDRFRVFQIGFSLYERAWTLRGMENLLMDFLDHPDFVHELLAAIADYNIAQVRRGARSTTSTPSTSATTGASSTACRWARGSGASSSCRSLGRMYGVVRDAGKFVMIHSCGEGGRPPQARRGHEGRPGRRAQRPRGAPRRHRRRLHPLVRRRGRALENMLAFIEVARDAAALS